MDVMDVLVGLSLSAYLPPALVLVAHMVTDDLLAQGKLLDLTVNVILLSNLEIIPLSMLLLGMFSSTVCKVIAQNLGRAALP